MIATQELTKPVIKTSLPGPKSLEIINADAQYVTPSYPRPDYKLVCDHASGVWITDPDGNTFLDCNAGVAVCSTGHCHPEIVAAVSKIMRLQDLVAVAARCRSCDSRLIPPRRASVTRRSSASTSPMAEIVASASRSASLDWSGAAGANQRPRWHASRVCR